MFELVIEFVNENFWLCLTVSLIALVASIYKTKRFMGKDDDFNE